MKIKALHPIIVACLFGSITSVVAFPSYDPFADASGATPPGSHYNVGDQLGVNTAIGVPGQTNALGDVWSAINTSTGISSATAPFGVPVFLGNLVPTYATFPSGFLTAGAASGNSVMTTNVNAYGARLNLGRTFTNAPGSNIVYASFLIRADNIAGLSSSGQGAFNASFHQGTGISSASAASGNFPEELRLIADSTHSTYKVGVSKDGGTAADTVFDPAAHTVGEVIFVVMGYKYVDNSSDVASIWINPDPSTFGSATVPTPTQSNNSLVNNANDFSINSFQIMSRNTTQPNRMIFDEVRVSSTWAYVTGGAEITSQPTSLTNGAGTTATFAVAGRSGSANSLTYQWYKGAGALSNGGTVAGSTTTALTLSSLSTSDAASYTCVVGNTIGNVTSSVATLTILDPSISVQPVASQSVAPGATVNMAITAVGTAPLTYKWRLNGVELTEDGVHIINSGTPTLTVANTQVADVGSYTCVVTNGVNSTATSANSVLAIADPIVTAQPSNVSTNFDSTVTFSVTVAGTSPFHYQWQKNGINLVENAATGNGGVVTGATAASGSTNETLTLTHVAFADAGSYSCIVTNDHGDSLPHSTTSSSATLSVQDPVFTSQPTNQTVNQGQNAAFTVGASGTPTISYQWYKGATALTDGSGTTSTNGSTTSSLALTGVTSANAGNYRCVISGADSKSYTNAAVSLTVITPVTVASGPTNRFLRVGDHTALAVSASGSPTITYVWDHNGSPISGATTSVLALNSLQTGDSGTYTVTMNNSFGTPTTAAAIVDVTSSLRHLTVGNLVISRLGDGAQTLQVTNGNTIYIDQFDTNGNYVSSVMIPDDTSVNSGALIVAGQDNTGGAAGLGEAILTTSPNNTFLSLAGYNVTRPYTNISGATISGDNASIEPRGIGLVNGLGYYQMRLRISSSAITGSLRSAYTDDTGTNFWLVGGSLGVRYFNTGSAGSGVSITGGSGNNNRFVDVFNGNMYFDSATNTGGIFKMTGAPTTAAANSQAITYPLQNQLNEFAVSSDEKTIYLTSGAIGDSAGSGVERWDLNGVTWTSNKVFASSSGLGARGLVVDWNGFTGNGASGTGATLYFTTAETNNNKLVKVVDVASPTTTLLASAGPNQIFRSVKFAPTSAAPSITGSPAATVATNGATVTMSASVSGSAPLTLVWNKNGLPISDGPTGNGSTYAGSSTTTLTITGAVAADSGSYSIGSVTNDLGSAGPSGNGVLTVLNPGATPHANFGDSVIFTATSGTVSGVTYQWKKAGNNLGNGTTTNGSVIIGATSASLTIQNVNYGDGSGDSGTARTYSCTVTATSSGSSAFQTDGLSVSDPYTISVSGDQTNGIGSTATFHVVAGGSPTIGYAWRKNGVNITDGPTGTGATYTGTSTDTLTISGIQSGDAATYSVKLGSCCGQTGNPAPIAGTLIIIDPIINAQPVGATIQTGQTATFSVDAAGTALTYQWRKGGIDLADGLQVSGATVTGATLVSLTVANSTVADTGNYSVVVTGSNGSVTSSDAALSVTNATVAVTITDSVIATPSVLVADGTNVTLSVGTTGSDPKTYQWYVKDFADAGAGTLVASGASNQVVVAAEAIRRDKTTATNVYYVIVDNAANAPQTSTNAKVTIVVDNKSPAPLVLTSPAKNGKYGSGTPTLPFKPYAITGTATDPAKGHIAHVRYYYINSNTPPFVPSAIYEAPLVDKNAGTTGDSIVLFNITTNPPLAGTNLIAIWPVDLAGNAGKGVTNAFFYSIPIPFTLHKVGDGTGAVSFVDKMGDKVNTSNIVYFGVGTVDKTVNMNEGETYTLSYTPDRTTNNVKNLPSVISVVTNAPGWGGPTNSIKKYTGPAITVEPTTNSVSFEFDRDRFVDMAGNYNAVLTADTNNPTLGTSRYLHLTVAKSRVATGYLMDAAHVHDAFAVHSSVDSAGHLHLQTALNSIVIDGDLAWTGSENPTGIKQFTGSVTFVNTSNAVVVADLEDKNALPTPGFATMSIPGVNNNPGGSGIATHKLLNGSVTSIYTLGDDDKHPATWPLKGSRSGNIPQWIITKTGVLFGNMNATDGLSNVIAPSLSWIRNPTPVLGYTYANLLPGGFVNSPFAAVASHYDNSVHPGLTGAFTLSLSGGGLANDTNTTLIFSGNTFTTNAPSPVTGGKVDPVSGKLTVIFLDGLPSKHKTTALGVVLQNATNGAGFFIRGATTIPTNSGSLTLTPQ